MLVVLSPAKNLDFDSPHPPAAATKPVFAKEAAELVETARALSATQIRRLMGVSPKLAEMTHARFEAFRTTGRADGARPALYAFNGDVYQGLDAYTLGTDDVVAAQERLRILSGLYGVLRPLDAIQPYRLEMGLKFKNRRGGSLYEFWGDAIAKELDKAAAHSGGERLVVNLASEEYFSAVDPAALKSPVIAVQFREEKDGKLRSLQFFAKRARGALARWIIRQRIDKGDDIRAFDIDGYRWRRDLAKNGVLVFTRPQPPLKKPA